PGARGKGAGGPDAAARVQIRDEFLRRIDTESWGYCTSFAIEGHDLDPSAIRVRAAELGKSTVVAGDDAQVKVHLHSADPGPALSYGASLGTLSNVSILNMDEQSREWQSTVASPRRGDAVVSLSNQGGRRPGEGTRVSTATAPSDGGTPRGSVTIAVVAVAAGEGLARLFVSNGLGVCSVVTGGDTMNPSTGDLLAAVERAPSESVIVLPNNRNVVGTANQVAGLTSKKVWVVPTTSMQAGLAAILAFSTDQPIETNVAAMKEATGAVKSISIARAVRDSRSNGTTIRAGQVLGLVDGDIDMVGDEPAAIAISLLTKHAMDAELVTIYRGADATRPDAEKLASDARSQLPGVNVEVVDGDQPYYPYLISVE
ncbi:MAG: hypothetical protein HY678_08655, partial [Chloroflexi bacterium]|nr:hypothetical protein [Chloroflexota bacterium]